MWKGDRLTDYWISTKTNPKIFKQSKLTPEIEAYLRSSIGVDPAIMSLDLKLSAQHIMSFQRQLGLRKISGGYRKGV